MALICLSVSHVQAMNPTKLSPSPIRRNPPAALLPLRLAGIDAKPLLRGAKAMAERCTSKNLLENPAGLLAAIHVQQMRLFGRSIHVLMPYADALRPIAAWFVQLWAESLGKQEAGRHLHGESLGHDPDSIELAVQAGASVDFDPGAGYFPRADAEGCVAPGVFVPHGDPRVTVTALTGLLG